MPDLIFFAIPKQEGFANGYSHGAIGVKIIGSVQGSSDSEYQSSNASTGVKTSDNGDQGCLSLLGYSSTYTVAWPPVISTTLNYEVQDDNPHEEHEEPFLTPLATHAGYYDTWTIYWVVQGPILAMDVRGSEYIGGLKYPSWGKVQMTTSFRPDFSQ